MRVYMRERTREEEGNHLCSLLYLYFPSTNKEQIQLDRSMTIISLRLLAARRPLAVALSLSRSCSHLYILHIDDDEDGDAIRARREKGNEQLFYYARLLFSVYIRTRA